MYHFLPFYSKSLELLNQELGLYTAESFSLVKGGDGTFIYDLDQHFSLPTDLVDQLSFLFALVLIYGKFDIKNQEVVALRLHIPLF